MAGAEEGFIHGPEIVSALSESGADTVVACDEGCLLHIEGGLRRHAANVKALHLAEVLAPEE